MSLEFPEMARSPRHPGKSPIPPVEEVDDEVRPDSISLPEADPSYQHFSRALRARRTKLGLTQLQLAGRAGVALGTVHIVEMARANPMLKSLVTLAEAVGLKVGDLLPQSIPHGEEELRERIKVILDEELDAAIKALEVARARVERLEHHLALLRDLAPP